MDLGVIVVSYNTRALTCDCLTAAYASIEAAALDAHIWVVDNASSDGSADEVRRRFPQATLIASDANLGFAGGNNAALQAMAASEETPYLDYIELRNAIEALGGDAPEREFDAEDPAYEAMRNMQ